VIPGSRRKNRVAPFKKEHWKFYTDSFPALRAPIARLNRFRRRKNSSNGSASRLTADWVRPDPETDRGHGRPVTTAHLLLQHALGKIVALLPFWLRNPGSLAGEILSLIRVSRRPAFSLLSAPMTARGGGGPVGRSR
jgi:hypothetical protein